MMLLNLKISIVTFFLCIVTQIMGAPVNIDPRSIDQTITITIDTPIPATISLSAVLDVLHDADTMIHLNPLVKSSALTSAPAAIPAVYSITDTLFGIIPTTYIATFQNGPASMDTVVSAGLGITTTGHWEVTSVDGSSPTLHERCDVTGNVLLLPLVRSQVQSSHEQLHQALIAKLTTGS
ncbi:hypothetical protein B0O99DRAFT_634483 [Bisporella sp. PMI_857]|nr:hypothetical protein B0O99DRAFT_634483 [Bisporella sp. PMI_857]